MQITTISDTHGLHHQLQLPGGDLLIHAGDVCNRGTVAEAIDFMTWFINQNYKYHVFIAGNHDFYFENFTQQEIQDMLPENAYYLNDSGVEIEGIKIWGSPITPTFFDLAYNKDRGVAINSHWEKIPNNTNILITHGPPYGMLDKNIENRYVGCNDLLTKVKEIQPNYHIFGHIHEGFGMIQNDVTTYINTSSVDFNYKVRKVPFVSFTY
jgi:Icc-related predicted phosphoesterase